MHLFEAAAHTAQLLWIDNEHWLNASLNKPGLDQRGMSEMRVAENLRAVNSFYLPE
jgi:hypothetical protein